MVKNTNLIIYLIIKKLEIMAITIKQKEKWFNPYFYEGLQIDRIIFYQDNKVLFSDNWFKKTGSNNSYPEFILDQDKIIKKQSIDLSSEKAFITKAKDEVYNLGEKRYNLYIPLDSLNHEHLGEKINFQDAYEINYISETKISLKAIEQLYRLDQVGELEYYNSDLKECDIIVRHTYRSQSTNLGKKAKKISEITRVKIYDIKNILDVANISLKR